MTRVPRGWVWEGRGPLKTEHSGVDCHCTSWERLQAPRLLLAVCEYLLVFTGLGSDRNGGPMPYLRKAVPGKRRREQKHKIPVFVFLTKAAASDLHWPAPKWRVPCHGAAWCVSQHWRLSRKGAGLPQSLWVFSRRKGAGNTLEVPSPSSLSFTSCFCARQTYKIRPPRFTFPF